MERRNRVRGESAMAKGGEGYSLQEEFLYRWKETLREFRNAFLVSLNFLGG